MPVILVETLADFGLPAFKYICPIKRILKLKAGGGGGVEGSESPVFSRSVSTNYLIERAIN